MLRLLPSTIRLAPRQLIYDKIQGPIIGIDLGTFNSRVAVMDGDKVKVIEHAGGARAIPSYVTVKEDGKYLVGEEAKRQALLNPENTLYATKRFIGRRFDAPEVQKFLASSPYTIIEEVEYSEYGKVMFYVQRELYTPPEVTTLILKKLKDSVESYLGESVENAVMTVPPYFYHSQIEATKKAFKKAGLNVLRTIDEPVAAAIAYTEKKIRLKVAKIAHF